MKTAKFIVLKNFLLYGITNKLKLFICSPQASGSFKHFNTLTTSTYTTTTFITEAFHLITDIQLFQQLLQLN